MLTLFIPYDLFASTAGLHHMLDVELEGGLGKLLTHYLIILNGSLAALESPEIPVCCRGNAKPCGRMSRAHPGPLEGGADPVDVTLLSRARRMIDGRLADRNLTSETLCKALGVSRSASFGYPDRKGKRLKKEKSGASCFLADARAHIDDMCMETFIKVSRHTGEAQDTQANMQPECQCRGLPGSPFSRLSTTSGPSARPSALTPFLGSLNRPLTIPSLPCFLPSNGQLVAVARLYEGFKEQGGL